VSLAQALPPAAPPVDRPLPGEGAGDAQGRPARWTLSLGAHQLWDSSPRMVAEDAAVHLMGRASAGLSHARLGRRGTLVASAGVSSSFAEDPFAADRLLYDASLAAGGQLGARLRLSVTDSVQSTYTDEAPALDAEGAVVRRGPMLENTARVQLQYQWSPRTTLTTELRHELIGFDDQALLDRSRAAIQTAYGRRLGRSQSLRLDHLYQVRLSEGQRGAGHRLFTSWSGTRQDRQTLAVSLGVEVVENLAGPGHLTRPYGSLELSSRSRHGGVSLRYQRSFTLAYETFDNRATDAVGLTVDRALGRRAGATVGARYSIRQDPAGIAAADHMARFMGGLSLRLAASLDAVSTYSYQWRRIDTGAGRHRVDVGLSYGRTWW
jgi:hypothetical protein